MNIDQYSATVIDRLGAMAVVAEKHGITLIHENEKGIYGDNDTRCNEILTALAPYGLKLPLTLQISFSAELIHLRHLGFSSSM